MNQEKQIKTSNKILLVKIKKNETKFALKINLNIQYIQYYEQKPH